VGAVVFVEHWIFPLLGWNRFWAARKGLIINLPALVAWWGSLAAALAIHQLGWMHLFFLPVPVWCLTASIYIILSAVSGARQALPALAEDSPTDVRSVAAQATAGPSPMRSAAYYLFGIPALLSLMAMIWLGVATFRGSISPEDLKFHLIAATAIYYAAGIPWLYYREKMRRS
jgi:cytosine permease